jgi:hypothetical protein
MYNYNHSSEFLLNDFRGLSSSKVLLNLSIDYKIFSNTKLVTKINGYKDFIYNLKPDSYKHIPTNYDNYININELYLSSELFDIDFKIGRQIEVWGKSDNIKISDVLNNTDNRIPAIVDIKDIKLGRAMIKATKYINDWDFNALILLENRYSLQPQFGSDFAPTNKQFYEKFKSQKIKSQPSNDIENIGIAFNANANLKGQDLSLYYVNQFMDNSSFNTSM